MKTGIWPLPTTVRRSSKSGMLQRLHDDSVRQMTISYSPRTASKSQDLVNRILLPGLPQPGLGEDRVTVSKELGTYPASQIGIGLRPREHFFHRIGKLSLCVPSTE